MDHAAAAAARLSPDALEAAGRALYGDQWVSALARDLGVARRRIQFWRTGDPTRNRPPGAPLRVASELAALLRARAQDASAMAEAMERLAPPA
jgi:hypothetical protein